MSEIADNSQHISLFSTQVAFCGVLGHDAGCMIDVEIFFDAAKYAK